MRTALDLGFKGNRDYVQGPDICLAVIGELRLPSQAPFRMSIHHFARRQCELVVADRESAQPANVVALFWTTNEGMPVQGWVVEGDSLISRRTSYDEEPIWSRSERSGNQIHLNAADLAGYAPIEVLVSVTKKLHLDTRPATRGKWVFTQLDISRLLVPSDVAALRVNLDQALGQRFTKSSVFVGTERLGSIHFANLDAT